MDMPWNDQQPEAELLGEEPAQEEPEEHAEAEVQPLQAEAGAAPEQPAEAETAPETVQPPQAEDIPEEEPAPQDDAVPEPVQTPFSTADFPLNVPAEPEPAAVKPKKKHTALKIAALFLCCTLLGGGAGIGGAWLFSQKAAQPGPGSAATIYQGERTPTVVSVASISTGKVLTPPEVYASNLDSCVGITVTTTTNFYGYTTSSAVSGSGFVLTQDGYIVTNYHVIEEAAEDPSQPITVFFNDGTSYQAQLIGGEKDNDIAVLKIDAQGLRPVVLGDSGSMVVGDPVYAIGNPLGELTFSFTGGLVSALDRVVTTGSGSSATSLNMLQTDCAINSGNSGGPLFNCYGEVIGVTTAKMSSSGSSTSASVEGLGFAIPINDVKHIIQDLIQYGYVTGKPYMGITVSTISDAEAKRYGLSVGAYVESMDEGSCSEKAGLQVGDIITAMDDTEITTHLALGAAKATYRAGDTVTLTIERGRETLKLTLTFDEMTPDAQQQPVQQPAQSTEPSGGQYPGGGQYGNGFDFFFPWFG